VGGNASSDNIGPLNLINIRRVAYGLREIEDIRPKSGETAGHSQLSGEMVDLLVKKIVEQLKTGSLVTG